MTNGDIHRELASLLALDCPSNYDCAESAIESILDEIESEYDVSVECHNDMAEMIEQWFEGNGRYL